MINIDCKWLPPCYISYCHISSKHPNGLWPPLVIPILHSSSTLDCIEDQEFPETGVAWSGRSEILGTYIKGARIHIVKVLKSHKVTTTSVNVSQKLCNKSTLEINENDEKLLSAISYESNILLNFINPDSLNSWFS